jgi:nicotinate-nucleotide pyrophosphorylase (carboxylating)
MAKKKMAHETFEKYFDVREKRHLKELVAAALEEDIGSGDVTTAAIIPAKAQAKCRLMAKQKGIICGLPLTEIALSLMTKKYKITWLAKDGDPVKPGQVLAEIEGPAVSLLEAERVLLNYLQRLSGIATLTHAFVEAVKPYKTAIMDTRKTTPLCRLLEKYAVSVGGGKNHRFGLYDQVLIKDNHIDVAGGIEEAIRKVRRKNSELMIEVEARTLDEVKRAITFRPEIILLDNMTPAQMKKAVDFVQGKAQLEASGGVNLKTVAKIAATGVDRISIGALTHSAPAMDISLKIKVESWSK